MRQRASALTIYALGVARFLAQGMPFFDIRCMPWALDFSLSLGFLAGASLCLI